MRILLALLAIITTGSMTVADDQHEWEFQLTPYLWLPTISGDLNYDMPPEGGAPSVGVGPTDWLDLLNGMFLINGEMRKGRFSLFTDFVHLGLESDQDRIKSVQLGNRVHVDIDADLNTKTEFDGVSWTLAAGYTVQESEALSIDLITGVRYFGVDASTNWQFSGDITTPNGGVALPAQGRISKEVDLWDGIIGVRGRLMIGEGNWSVNYYADIGTGSSDLTWQAMTGLNYRYRWGDLMLVFRHIEYNEGDGGLLEDFSFSGPAFGARFGF